MAVLHPGWGQVCPASLGEFGAEPEFTQASALPTTLIISPLSGALTSSAVPWVQMQALFPAGGSAQL